MKTLNYQLKALCKTNRDGSYATQSDRFKSLQLIATQLHSLGYRQMNAQSLKPKHVTALIDHWRSSDIATGTLKNRLSHLRWWARKIGKHNVLAKQNDVYGIGQRQFVAHHSKACQLEQSTLSKITNPHVKMSLQLQQAFGLRREEAIKFIPSFADQGGDSIVLKASWTKGGKERTVPILTPEQRTLLDKAKELAGGGSLIPPQFTYIKQLGLYERHTTRAGLSKMHGLRHHYAQQRYEALTGWPCPVCGGPTKKQLSDEQREQDKIARQIISRELGHERLQILQIYCA